MPISSASMPPRTLDCSWATAHARNWHWYGSSGTSTSSGCSMKGMAWRQKSKLEHSVQSLSTSTTWAPYTCPACFQQSSIGTGRFFEKHALQQNNCYSAQASGPRKVPIHPGRSAFAMTALPHHLQCKRDSETGSPYPGLRNKVLIKVLGFAGVLVRVPNFLARHLSTLVVVIVPGR